MSDAPAGEGETPRAASIELVHGALRSSAWACGEPGSPVVLCLHGFPDNARSFRFQLPELAKAGYYAVAPTLRGYEPSSQPADDRYDLGALAEDAIAWSGQLGEGPVHLVGHDWGAGVGYVAAAMAPDRFRSLATIAVPHAARLTEAIRAVPSQLAKSWYMTFFQLPGVAEWALERDDWALVRRLWRDWSPGFELPAEEWAWLRATFAAPGVKHAMLAYYRQNASPAVMLGLKKTPALALTTVTVPTLAITGADDGCMDTRIYDHAFRAEDFPAGHRVERLVGVGHFAHQEAPGRVNRLLLDWLASAPGS